MLVLAAGQEELTMPYAEIIGLSLGWQVALGAGYLAYATAYAGLRRDHRATDVLFITLAFAALALVVFTLLQWWIGDGIESLPAAAVAAGAALVGAVLAGAAWRKWARGWWQSLLQVGDVHREDGVHFGWDAIVQASHRVGQLSVHTIDGRVLYLNDRSRYGTAPWGGLYLGGDGSITMVVEEEELPDGTEEVRIGIDGAWGTRMTYLPPDVIRRVNIRMK